MIIKSNKLSLVKLMMKLKIMILLLFCMGHIGLLQAANSITLPVEVIGTNYTVESRTFDLSPPNNASALWMQVNNLSYDNKASVSINGGPWISLTNASVNMQEPEKTFGGIGGEAPTLRFSIAANNFVDGSNTVQFRFNEHDGFSLGYRVVKFNVLDASDNKLLPEQDFEFEDPELWQAPIAGATAIANGKTLYESAQLIEPGTTNNINAKCMDCHSNKGFDLEYFSYSNHSIIQRSKFHGLTQTEGEEIASYIRSLSAQRHGRPWNPPYQPGSQLNGKSIEQWAAGAGLDAVLETDTDMEPYLFPNGTSQLEVDKVVDFNSHLDVTELPIAIQLPDWKSWLPKVHPKDIWPNGYFESGEAGQEYANIISTLESANVSQMITSGNIVNFLDNLQFKVKRWIDTGRDGSEQAGPDRWRVLSGTVINNIKSQYPREFGKVNYAKWMAVKYFEMMHEYDLEYLAHLNPDVPLIDAIEGTRQWPNEYRTLFEIAPHFTADNIINFADQTLVEGKYMSTAWYQLQMLVHAGEYDQLEKGGPMDWAYHFLHINEMTDAGAPREGFRYMSSFLKLWQTRSNGFAGNDLELGWRMRYVHPWWIYSDEYGDQSSMNDLNVNDPDLRVKIYNAAIDNWVTEVRKYNLATWPRGSNDWVKLDPASHVPSADNVDFGSNRLWKAARQYHADYFYVLIPRLALLGVDVDILTSLADWCEEAWPLGDWYSLLDGSGVPLYSDSAFVSQNVPNTIAPGATVEVNITMNNDGTETWDPSSFRLGSQNVQGNTTWGTSRVNMTATVAPGANKTFTFNITAPNTQGTYNFQWKMVNDGVEWFGALSDNVVIEITDAVPLPGVATMLSPADGGNFLSIETELSWTVGAYATSHQVLFGTDAGNLASTTQSASSFDPGTLEYDTTYYWQINENNATGTTTGNLWSFTTESLILVNDASFTAQNGVTANMTTGDTVSVTVTMKNTGSTTWTKDDLIQLGSQNVQDNSTWGFNRVELAVAESVAPGGEKTFAFDITVPALAGTYNFQWQMVQDEGEWFGASSTNVAINVSEPLPLPGTASNESPVGVDVSIDTDLTWTAGSDATSHEVLFGTDAGNLTSTTQSGTSFDPGTLLNSTTYYWQINEINGTGTTLGALWSFTTIDLLPPSVATIVSPANISTDVSLASVLSWTAGTGATSHEVLFGTDPANLASTTQSGTSFDPGALANNTTYYWQINEINATATTTGALWSFTTIDIPLPGAASIVGPADGSNNISIATDLSWTAGSDATSHEVLFGTDQGNLASTTQSSTSFDPGTLTVGTTYYWQINEINEAGTTTGALWSFTTQSAVFPNDAVFVSQSVPASMTPGQTVSVSLTMKNIGTNTWTESGLTKLGSQNAQGNTTWGTSRIWLAVGESVAPNAQHTFVFNVTAPTSEGTYNFQWKMVQEQVGWFGAQSANIAVIVSDALPLPGVASILSPANASTDLSINTSLTWAAGSNATSHEVLFGTNPSELASTTQSGTSFNPGTLANNTTYYWQINESNIVGTTTGVLWSFTTTEPLPDVASIINPADGSIDLSINTDLSWTAGSGAIFHEVLFGTDAGNLTSTTQSGTSFDPGTLAYSTTYYWQINEINTAGTTNGTLWSFTTEATIVLNGATFVSQNVPASMAPGETVSVSVTLNNAGTSTWTTADGYNLGSQNAQDNTTWGANRIPLTEDVAPGDNTTFTFDVTAPSTQGTHEFQWRMLQNNVQWFGGYTTNVSVDVSSVLVEIVLSESYFETDWDGWIDGDGSGAMVKRQKFASRAAEGEYSIKIKDNEGESSAVTSPTYDISSYDQITIDYQYYPHNQAGSDGYFVQYYDGSTWQTIATYMIGTDFQNGQFYSESHTLSSSNYTFPADAKFRFESDGGGGGRHIYIDAIIITASTGGGTQ